MGVLKRHAIMTTVATICGILAVFWLRPTTNGGTVFIVTVCLIIVNGIGVILEVKPGASRKPGKAVRSRRTPTRFRRNASHKIAGGISAAGDRQDQDCSAGSRRRSVDTPDKA